MRRTMQMTGGAIVTAIALLCASCGGTQSFPDAAVELIEDEFSQRLGAPLESAACVEPASTEVGTTFTCEAQHFGRPVLFDARIEPGDQIVVRSTNVVYVDQQVAIGEAIAKAFADQGVSGLSSDSFDCGGSAVALDSENTVICTLRVPPDNQLYSTAVRVSDLENLVFDFVVADEPLN